MIKCLLLISAIFLLNCECSAQTAWVRQQSGLNSELRAVAFFDSLLGFAAGDSCVKTTDGGKHWRLMPEIKKCGDILIDSNHNIYFSSSICDTFIYSTDSGKTLSDNKYSLSLNGMKLPSGFYIAKFQGEDQTFTLPLILR
jgi:hypothetical protein